MADHLRRKINYLFLFHFIRLSCGYFSCKLCKHNDNDVYDVFSLIDVIVFPLITWQLRGINAKEAFKNRISYALSFRVNLKNAGFTYET